MSEEAWAAEMDHYTVTVYQSKKHLGEHIEKTWTRHWFFITLVFFPKSHCERTQSCTVKGCLGMSKTARKVFCAWMESFPHLTANRRTSFYKALHIQDDVHDAPFVFNQLLIEATHVTSGWAVIIWRNFSYCLWSCLKLREEMSVSWKMSLPLFQEGSHRPR